MNSSCSCGAIRFEASAVARRPTGLTLERHKFVADKGDYDEIPDGALLEEHENG